MNEIKQVLLDIDGVIKVNGKILENIDGIIDIFDKNGVEIKFVTNCSLHKINRLDIGLIPGRVFTIIDPLDVFVDPMVNADSKSGSSMYIISSKEISKKIRSMGYNFIQNNFERNINSFFIFEKLNYDQKEVNFVINQVLNGAKYYCAGMDRFYKFKNHVYAGVGAITQQIKYATNIAPIILGKPEKFIFKLALGNKYSVEESLFIGDDYQIDIVGAKSIGMRSALITCNQEKLNITVRPDFIGEDIMSILGDIYGV